MNKHFYKTVNDETGYSKYIKETDERTTIISYGAMPRMDIINGPYPRRDGELLQACTEVEFVAMNVRYIFEKKKVYNVEPSPAL